MSRSLNYKGTRECRGCSKNNTTIFITAFLPILLVSVICTNVSPDVNKYCREKNRLIASDELDEYLIVDVEINSTIILECRYCEDNNKDQQAKIWHWQDREQSLALKEVELGMDNNASLNRIHLTSELSLVIRKVTFKDAGIYRCFGDKGQEQENKFNYRLEPVFEEESTDVTERGNITDWEKYREINLVPVSLRFAVSNMREFTAIREQGVTLEVVSEWGIWGPCEDCVAGRGTKTKRAFCRIKCHLNKTIVGKENLDIVEYFRKTPLFPCRSRILQERFPSVSNATRHLPEFVLTEKCKRCQKEGKARKHKFKYKKRYVLAEGSHLAIACPESSMESNVVWRKDSLLLAKGTGHSFRKKDPEHRVLVDTYFTLYLKDVSRDEEGNYTCFVDNARMMQLKIIVVSKLGLITEAFVRHLGYLAFIFLLTLLCYCVGVVGACKNRKRFRIQNYAQLLENEKLLEK